MRGLFCNVCSAPYGLRVRVAGAMRFVGSASPSPPYGRRARVAVVGGWVAVAVVLFVRLALVTGWCVPTPLLGRAVLVHAPPHGEACCVGMFRFRFLVFCRLNARLVLLVRCCLRCSTAGVVGRWVSVVFA